MKSESLNFLEPSGPVQACNGNALPLPFTILTLVQIYSELNKCVVYFVGGRLDNCVTFLRQKYLD